MAEYISMKQVPGGTVTSVDDRILYDINLTNGKIYGCEVSYLGNNMIHINAGYGVIKGGLFEIEDHTEYVDFAESEPTPGQIYLHFDAAAQDKLTIVKETSATAHQLVQNEDANYESGVYEIQICTFTATTTALTDVTETWPTASGAMETLGTMEEVMANTEAGKVADALVTKQLNSNLTELVENLNNYKIVTFTGTLSSSTGYTQVANDIKYKNAIPLMLLSTQDETEFETNEAFIFKNNNGLLRFSNSHNAFCGHSYKMVCLYK